MRYNISYLAVSKKFSLITMMSIMFIILGCHEETTNSRHVATADLSTEIHISDYGANIISAEAMFKSGPLNSNTIVYLSEGDGLYISTIGDFANLSFNANNYNELDFLMNSVKNFKPGEGRSPVFLRNASMWYYQQIDNYVPNTPIAIIFERRDWLDARNTQIEIPHSFNIISPLNNTQHNRSSNINISWEANTDADTVYIEAILSCTSGQVENWNSGEFILDTGYINLPADTFKVEGTCNLNINIDKRNIAQVDPAFTKGGLIMAHQIRSRTLVTYP